MNCIKEITGHVSGQRLMLDQPVIVGETIDYITATFDFDERWNGTEKFVHFSHGEDSGYVLLNDDKITEDQHLNLGSGLWQVWIIGERTEGGEVVQRITTQVQTIRVEKSGVTDGEPFPEDTGSAGEQIVAQAIAAKEAAEAAQTAAEASKTAAGEYAGAASSSAAGAASSAALAADRATAAAAAALNASANAALASAAKDAALESMRAAEGHAEDAEGSASLAAGKAAAAAQSADDALGSARSAEESAEAAKASAEEIEDLTVSAHELPAGSTPTVEKTGGSGTPYNLDFGIPAGGGGGGADLPETTNLLKGNGEGGAEAAVPGTDYATPAQVDAKYTKPDSGIPASDLASGVLPSFSTDPDQHVYEINGKFIAARYDGNADEITSKYATKTEMNAKYTKPSGGIPKTDLASAVQTSLGKADTALQSVPNTYRTASAQDEIDNAQNTAINAKYTKPSTGIPASDLAPGVVPEQSEADGKDIVESIGAASTDEEIPTAKAVYDAVSPKQDKPALVTSGTAITLADNTEYRLTDVTSLDITYPSGSYECWMKISTAASGTISISFPAGTTYIGTVPQFGVGETWEISIKDGVVVAGKVVSS